MLGWIYGKIADARNALYEKNAFKSFPLGAKTVSVGNITVGGTGKTPLVARVSEILAAKGEKVCVLSRGYGRANPKQRVLVSDGESVFADARAAGDEPFELAGKLLGKAFVIADADRVAAAKWARENFEISAFVLDDAFQHRRARRDLDIVCIDATNPFGSGKVLPSGILREPLKNLKRAGAIVLTRANLIDEKALSELKSRISKFNSACPIFVSENRISELIELAEFHAKAQRRKENEESQEKAENKSLPDDAKNQTPKTKNQKALAFCALGNPENFFRMLRRENFDLAATRKFPDHHFYAQKDVAKIEKAALSSGAEILLTTAKDAVKLKNLKFSLPCFVVETEIFFADEKGFRALIESL